MTTIEQQLKECLQKPYKNAKRFLADVISPVFGEDNFEDAGNANVLRMLPELQPKADATGIKDIRKVGDLLIEGSELGIFDITLDYKKQLQRNRVEVQQIVRSIIATHSGAFIIFHYESGARWEWRFTFCHKGASASESSDAKRYTFLLGPGQSCRTAAENFTKIHEKIEREGEFEMQDIISAFDVEALSKEFFAKYKNHYERFCQFVYENKNDRQFFGEQFSQWEDKVIRDYVKKLLGRIVFLHFIQKKGWLGVPADKTWNEGDRQFMKNLYDRASQEQKDNYLDIVLEPLFQKGLDRNRSAEGDIFDTGVEGFRNVKIPYLNGGLFERDVMDEPDSRFPSEYFGDLLEFLYEYNFTIDENDPNDAEVGVDPEMLGRIFENLLEDNKDKGAFYTPKEIVQYMCRESLIAYLTTNSIENGNTNPRETVEKAIRNLVLNPEEIVPKMNDKQKEGFGEALRKVKICDPAIGSGAFPMGLLNELVRCRVAISAWAKDNDGNVLVDDYAALKREIVCNNIYGVDIERGAIDIARLRFWLSIVVDEKEPHALPNLDYKFMEGNSLIPTFDGQYINLDTKYQQHRNVNSMIKEKKQLYNLKQEHYNATGLRKHQLAVGIKDCILNLISLQLDYEIKKMIEENSQTTFDDIDKSKEVKYSEIIKRLPEDKRHVCELGRVLRTKLKDNTMPIEERAQIDIRFFDWRMMFTEVFEGEEPGFDIVIGNPPYIQLQTDIHKKGINKKGEEYEMKLGDLYKDCNFETFEKTGDIYCLFYEHGINILRDSGVLCFITSNKWMRAKYGTSMRNFFVTKCNPTLLIDFSGTKIFENATVDVNIIQVKKESNQGKTKSAWLDDPNDINDLSTSFNSKSTVIPFTHSDAWTILSSVDMKIKATIESAGKPLGNWNLILTRGVGTGFDEAYILTNEQKENLLSQCSNEELERTKSIIKPMLRGREISKYIYSWSGLWMIYIPIHFPLQDNPGIKGASKEAEEKFAKLYPIVYNHICNYKEKLSSRDKTETGIRYEWYCMQRARYDKFGKLGFSKIVYQELSQGSTFALDCNGQFLLNNSAYYIHSQSDDKYLIGLLNSKLIEYAYSKYYCTKLGKTGVRWLAQNIVNLPIVEIEGDKKTCIIQLVDNILTAKNTNPKADTSIFESKINQIVYELYGLTEDQIKIIEG